MQGRSRWHFEAYRSVGFHRGGAQNPLHPISLGDGDRGPGVLIRLLPGGVGFGIDRQHPHIFHLVFWKQGVAFKDIGAVEHPILQRRLVRSDFWPGDPIRNNGRLFARLEWHSMPDIVLAGVDQLPIAIQIHQIQAEFPGFGIQDRHQEVLLANRVWRIVGGIDTGAIGVDFRLFLRAIADFRPADFSCHLAEAIWVIHPPSTDQ